MAKIFKLPQQHIHVQVDYYDDEQKKKLLGYPSAEKIRELVQNGAKIPTPEFLTYYLFHRKRPGKPGYRDYKELGKKIGKSLTDLEDFISYNNFSISTPLDIVKQDTHITERIGESVGLSIVNRIHNLSEADWDKIPEIGGKKAPRVFDYVVASDGTSIIQVETKGSSINNNDFKPSTVSKHKSSIIDKKTKIAKMEAENSYPYPANLRYGTITVLDCRTNSTARCWLVDPKPDKISISASKLRLINRMRFLRDWISFISPRSQFASALSTRVADVEALSNPYELNNIPLIKGNGKPFEIMPNCILNKSYVVDGPAHGIVIQISDNNLFFIGIKDELSVLSAEQNFMNIVSYKSSSKILSKMIQCVFYKTRFKQLKLPNWIINEAQKDDDYFSFKLEGDIMYTQDGLVFGVLPIEGE